MPNERVVIIGAGPCGLACARELESSASDSRQFDVRVLEIGDRPGGLAASVVDPAGFTWDRGGHVVFSHYGEFDRLLADTMGEDVVRHDRSSYVHIGGEWVPYPLQNNLHRLPSEMAEAAIIGLVEAQCSAGPVAATRAGSPGDEVDFGTWLAGMFGSGIVDHFMRPYNEKVWAQPVSAMSSQWMAERVSTVDWRQALRSLATRRDDVAWGPNNLFAFPSSGGTGEIYRRAALPLEDRITYGVEVIAIDATTRSITLSNGDVIGYDHLVSTGPLDHLVDTITDIPSDIAAAAGALVHNSVTVVGVGYEAPLSDERSWLYFPDTDVPFYRATNFAKYAAANVPGSDTARYCSWMTEIASSPWRPLATTDDTELGARVDDAIRTIGLVANDAPVASVHVEHLRYGYPVPTLGRDRALATIQPWLMDRSILSRGRFGAWRYELGNMDHAVKMGVDAARLIADGTVEQAWSL
ncbi:MAG: FAD-dependent oxidoreductase [Ilumatobacteraceae bacterium]